MGLDLPPNIQYSLGVREAPTMNKTAPTPKTNLAAKSVLARLMAAEDIAVEVDSTAPTAYFNVEERRLVLPLWDVEGDAYDMLVGHEVSHALYTPKGAASLEAACKRVDPKHLEVAKAYLNVVEDARIERMIKVDYPGLRRSFAAGYREFHARDLFGIKGKEVTDLALIDRVNLQYKIGWLIDVPFTAAELPLVQRVAETRTWDEVVELSKDLYEFAKKQKEEEKEENQQGGDKGKPQQGDDDGEASAPSEAGDDEETGTDTGADGLDNDTDDDAEEGEGKSLNGKDGDETDDQGGGESKGDGTAEGDETDDDGETAESEEKESDRAGTNEGTVGNGEQKDFKPDAPTTDKALTDALSKMVKQKKRPMLYADLPTMPKDLVVPFATVEAAWAGVAKTLTRPTITSDVLAVWKNKNQSDVLALATEFERRKAADAHKRTMTAETGSIDPTRLFAYKISDDIFLRSSTVRDGKNHGIVVLLDMSGSMSNQLLDTVVQLVNLTAFARRVNIPFKVYGFIDYHPSFAAKEVTWGVAANAKAKWVNTGRVRLLTLLESGTTQARWQNAAGHLLTWAAAHSSSSNAYTKAIKVNNLYYDVGVKYSGGGFTLNGTPTNEALMALLTLVPEFKKKHGLQVVNTVILTDGEAGDNPLTYQGTDLKDSNGWRVDPLVIVRDPLTRREYKAWSESKWGESVFHASEQQSLLVAMLKDRTGAKVININLVTGIRHANSIMVRAGINEMNPLFSGLRKKFKDQGFVSLPNAMGFDEVIALNTANATETDFDFDNVTVDTNSKAGQKELQKAFVKSLESRKGNRPLMARIAELVSKNL